MAPTSIDDGGSATPKKGANKKAASPISTRSTRSKAASIQQKQPPPEPSTANKLPFEKEEYDPHTTEGKIQAFLKSRCLDAASSSNNTTYASKVETRKLCYGPCQTLKPKSEYTATQWKNGDTNDFFRDTNKSRLCIVCSGIIKPPPQAKQPAKTSSGGSGRKRKKQRVSNEVAQAASLGKIEESDAKKPPPLVAARPLPSKPPPSDVAPAVTAAMQSTSVAVASFVGQPPPPPLPGQPPIVIGKSLSYPSHPPSATEQSAKEALGSKQHNASIQAAIAVAANVAAAAKKRKARDADSVDDGLPPDLVRTKNGDTPFGRIRSCMCSTPAVCRELSELYVLY